MTEDGNEEATEEEPPEQVTMEQAYRSLIGDGYLDDPTGNGEVYTLTQKGAVLVAFVMDTMTVSEMATIATLVSVGGELPWRIAPVRTPMVDGLKRGRSQ